MDSFYFSQCTAKNTPEYGFSLTRIFPYLRFCLYKEKYESEENRIVAFFTQGWIYDTMFREKSHSQSLVIAMSSIPNRYRSYEFDSFLSLKPLSQNFCNHNILI